MVKEDFAATPLLRLPKPAQGSIRFVDGGSRDLWVSGLRKARLSDVESADQYSVSAFVVRHRRTE
jgi:hypothetical protein